MSEAAAPAPSRLAAALWLELEGSTRSLGLLRLATATLLWSSWGFPFILHFDLHPPRLALALSFYLSSLLLLLGLWTRVAAITVALTLLAAAALLGAADPAVWLTQERQLSLLLAVVLALAPCGRSLSLDRLRALRRGRAHDERGPLWTLRLLQLCASVLFLTSAFGQLSPTWLGGHVFARPGAPAPAWAAPLAWTMLAINLVGALGPWWPRARLPAITLVAGAYLLLYTLMDLDTIALSIIALLFSFAPPARVHAVIDRLHGEAPRELPGR